VDTERIVILKEMDSCAIKTAWENNPGHAGSMESFLGKKICDGFVKKVDQPVLLTIFNNPNSAIFFGTLAISELKRLMDDPAVKCSHTAQDHARSLLFIIDSLDCAQS